MPKLSPNEFKVLANYILEISGISLEEGKAYLVESRLGPVLEEYNCVSFSELYHKARTDRQGIIEKKIIDGISIQETYFFRDTVPFDLMKYKLLPDLIDSRTKASGGKYPIRIRIWSAACATGQEVYSIAMTIKEMHLDPGKYHIQLMGTDISSAAVKRASYGVYNTFEVNRGLSKEQVGAYFIHEGNHWRIREDVRAMATFRKINLMEPLIGLGRFDIIFCRNVAIYFNAPDRRRLYEKIAGVLERDGCLIIGSTESLTGDASFFEPRRHLKTVYYQLKI